jgi:uncharacterized protein YbjT (DUF2867 family)
MVPDTEQHTISFTQKNIMHIVLTGSLGNISKPLAAALIQKGHAVTVISSHDDRKKEIEALGGKAAIGSLEDAAFLTDTFRGADAVYVMVPPNYAVPDNRAYYNHIGQSYKTAIEKAGVKRVVQLSSFGADLSEGTGPILGSHDVEAILDSIPGIAITHLRPASFYTNFYAFTDMIKQMGFIGSNYGGEDKLILVSPNDIAAVAAEELVATAPVQKVVYIASDEKTATETAHILGKAIGKPDLQWLIFPVDKTRDSLVKNGLSEHMADNMVEMGHSMHTGELRTDYEQHRPQQLGKTKLEDFAREFAAAYGK